MNSPHTTKFLKFLTGKTKEAKEIFLKMNIQRLLLLLQGGQFY